MRNITLLINFPRILAIILTFSWLRPSVCLMVVKKLSQEKERPNHLKALFFIKHIITCMYRGLWIPFNWENDQEAGNAEQAYNWLAPNSARGDLSEFTSPSNGNCLENFVAGERLTFPSEQPFALIDFILQRNKAWWIHKEAINCPWIFKIFDDDTLRVWQKNTVQCLTDTRPPTVVEIIE